MSPELSRRLGSALGGHVVTLAERNQVVGAAERRGVTDWADLPPDVQALVQEIEERPDSVDLLPDVPGPTRLDQAPNP